MTAPITMLWHPDSPGIRVPVRRGWLGRLFKPSEFATPGEVLAYYRAYELVAVARGVPAVDLRECCDGEVPLGAVCKRCGCIATEGSNQPARGVASVDGGRDAET
jgi:hypothetical protein